MYSLFEEQIRLESRQLDHHLDYFTDSFAESPSFFPDLGMYNIGPEDYLENIRRAKAAVDIPIIGSLNGITVGGWIDYAKKIEEAGADGLELNIYYIPTDINLGSAEVEALYLDILTAVRQGVSIPLAIKLSPYFSAPGNMIKRLSDAGANAAVLFNRFYQPDIDIEELEVTPGLLLSAPYELRLPLRWVAILYGRVALDFAITSGVHSYQDVLKGLMAGANVTMMASELLHNGVGRISEILRQMNDWMVEREYASVSQMRGSMSQGAVADPDTYERANYMKVLASWKADPAGQGLRTRRR
jgi:dihydroorotate dehydrogenase (fumarate)